MTTVLAVDDDPAILRTLRINLRARDYAVEVAGDGRSAIAAVDEHEPDVVLLDLGLPDLSGTAVIRRIRTFSSVPIVVLSARHESDDKVEALDAGADDYVTKPFGMEELLARVRAAARRGGPPGGATRAAPVEVDGLVLDPDDGTATRDGAEIHLTPTEWRIVAALLARRGRLVRQPELLREVWGPAYENETHYLRVYLAQIRRKLERDPANPALFVTEPGLGYRFAG